MKKIFSVLAAGTFSLILSISACLPYKNSPLISPPILSIDPLATASTGEVRALVIVVDFADTTYRKERLSTDTLQEYLFGSGAPGCFPCENLTDYFSRASYGAMHMSGDVFSYTASGNIADYESVDCGYETLVSEVLTGLDDVIDYARYDGNGDGYIDALCLSVPTGGNAEFWYGCTATWYLTSQPCPDGMLLYHYVISDEQPYSDTMDYYLGTLTHEYGHCMGLPDYYRYNTYENWEATTGNAGIERMDEACGDFCPLSKLFLGWYNSHQIQRFDLSRQTSQTFTLSDDSSYGSILLLPKKDGDGYFSEYFIVDYLTASGNYDGLFSDGGMRIYHVDMESSIDDWGSSYLCFDNFSPDYDVSGTGRRLLRLVNDGNGFFHAGDLIDNSIPGFAWYDSNGAETEDSGYQITVEKITERKCTVTVSQSK